MGLIQGAWRDPYEIPSRIIPNGMVYQWQSKQLFGKPDPTYQKAIDAGWVPVPFERHAEFYTPAARNSDGYIEIGRCVLMGRLREYSEESRDKEIDSAWRNTKATHRVIEVPTTLKLRLHQREIDAAGALNMSCRRYAVRQLQSVMDTSDTNTELRVDPVNGDVWFAAKRRPKHRWLAWLFELISTERQS